MGELKPWGRIWRCRRRTRSRCWSGWWRRRRWRRRWGWWSRRPPWQSSWWWSSTWSRIFLRIEYLVDVVTTSCRWMFCVFDLLSWKKSWWSWQNLTAEKRITPKEEYQLYPGEANANRGHNLEQLDHNYLSQKYLCHMLWGTRNLKQDQFYPGEANANRGHKLMIIRTLLLATIYYLVCIWIWRVKLEQFCSGTLSESRSASCLRPRLVMASARIVHSNLTKIILVILCLILSFCLWRWWMHMMMVLSITLEV